MISWDFPSYQYQRCLVIALRIHHVAFSRMSETWILTVGSQVDRPITAWWTVLIFTTSSWLLVEGLSHVLFMFHCFRDDPQWQAYFLWGFKKNRRSFVFLFLICGLLNPMCPPRCLAKLVCSYKNYVIFPWNIVDGRNPAPVGRWFIPLQSHYFQCFIGIQ